MSEPPRPATNARTLAAYEAGAELYARARYATPDGLLSFIDGFAARLRGGASVLEIGSATGHDADLLEARGLCVRRTDATEAFVRALRARGLEADVLNVLSDDLGGPWEGIYANAVFLHLDPDELSLVLARTAAAVLPAGLLAFTVKEGDGAGWSRHKLDLPRHFTYWREEPLSELVGLSPWRLETLTRETGRKDDWLQCLCLADAAAGEQANPDTARRA